MIYTLDNFHMIFSSFGLVVEGEREGGREGEKKKGDGWEEEEE